MEISQTEASAAARGWMEPWPHPLMPLACLLESALPSIDHAVILSRRNHFDRDMDKTFFFLFHVFLSLGLAFWGGYTAAFVRKPWQDTGVAALGRPEPGCPAYASISKPHFNFFKNNFVRIRAKKGTAGTSQGQGRAAAWTISGP